MTATRPSGAPYGPEGAGDRSEAGPDGDGPPQGDTALRDRLGGALAPHWPVHMSRNVKHHRKQILSAADAVLPVVEAETVAKDAEIRRLGEAVDADGGRIHRLRAELAEQRQRAEQAERERDEARAAVQRVREMAEQARGVSGMLCTCRNCEAEDWDPDYEPHEPTWTGWNLDPASILAALDGPEGT